VTRTATGEKVSRARRLERFRRARSLGAVSPNESIDSIDRRARVVVSRRGKMRTMRTMRARASVLLGMVRGVPTHRASIFFRVPRRRTRVEGGCGTRARDATLVREPCASIRRFVTP